MIRVLFGGAARKADLEELDAPKPTVPEPPSPVQTAIGSLRSIDQFQKIELDVLDRALANETNQAAAFSDILTFFTFHPERAASISSSRHFLIEIPDSISGRLAALASIYVRGHPLQHAMIICDELIRLADIDVSYVLKSRVAGRLGGTEAEVAEINAGLAAHPDSELLQLALIDCALRSGRTEEANRMLVHLRPKLQRHLAGEIAVAQVNQRDLEKAAAEGLLFFGDDKDIYTDEFCRSMWISYYESYTTRTAEQHGDPLLSDLWNEEVDRIAGDCNVVLDFGSMCADPIFRAALKHPKIDFYCFDRQPFIARLNAEAYPADNLHCREGDIFDAIVEIGRLPGRKALTHVRTTCILYPRFVEKLYAACRDAGIDYIIFIEGAGTSRTNLKAYDYDAMQTRSVVINHKLYLHDYKTMLSEAGYRTESFRRISTPGIWRGTHPDSYIAIQYVGLAKAAG